MTAPALNLVVLRSADLGRAARFYAALGIVLVPEKHGTGPDHLAGPVGAAVLELYPLGDAGPTTATRIGFLVADVDAAVAAVTNAGGVVVSAAKASPWGRRAVVADPDGHRVELTRADGV